MIDAGFHNKGDFKLGGGGVNWQLKCRNRFRRKDFPQISYLQPHSRIPQINYTLKLVSVDYCMR